MNGGSDFLIFEPQPHRASKVKSPRWHRGFLISWLSLSLRKPDIFSGDKIRLQEAIIGLVQKHIDADPADEEQAKGKAEKDHQSEDSPESIGLLFFVCLGTLFFFRAEN